MEQMMASPLSNEQIERPWRKIGLLVLLAVIIVAGGLLAYQTLVQQPESSLESAETITAAKLQERHGLKVHLVGVTAAGGMIDFRLKITDAQKAKRFLENPANLPKLIVAESGYELAVPEGLDDEIEFLDGGILFNFYPNDEGVIKAGTPVIVQFGTMQLEPQPAQ